MYQESSNSELKATLIEEVKQEIVAFLNSDGGTIYIGVNDDGSLAPKLSEKAKDEEDLKVSNWIQEAFFPSPAHYIKHFFNEDGVLVIVIEKGAQKPYFIRDKGPKPSGVWKREGRSKRKATEQEILDMILESRKYSFEKDISENQELTFRYLFERLENLKIPHEKRNQVSLGLISNNDRYTNLALILSDQSPIVVKFAKYDAQMNFLAKAEYKGSILKSLENVLDRVKSFDDVVATIDNRSLRRIERESYPFIALREGVLNAFAHADYLIRSNIKIEFFPDRLKITNPGGIFDASLEDIMNGVQTYRNPMLVNLLSKIGYLENFGTGIPRIQKAYESSKRKPEFNPTENFFTLSLPNLNFDHDQVNDQVTDQITDQITEPISDFDLAVLRFIRANPGEHATTIAKGILRDYPTATIDKVKNSVKRKLRNYVEFDGANKNGGYREKKQKEIK